MLFMSDHFHHVSDQFWLCSDTLSGHLLFLIGNDTNYNTIQICSLADGQTESQLQESLNEHFHFL